MNNREFILVQEKPVYKNTIANQFLKTIEQKPPNTENKIILPWNPVTKEYSYAYVTEELEDIDNPLILIPDLINVLTKLKKIKKYHPFSPKEGLYGSKI